MEPHDEVDILHDWQRPIEASNGPKIFAPAKDYLGIGEVESHALGSSCSLFPGQLMRSQDGATTAGAPDRQTGIAGL